MAIKFLSGLNLSNVTAGSILKLDSNGNIVMRFADTDYRQRPDYQTVIVAIQGWLEQQER